MNYGQSRIAAAAHNCQRFTTVSPSYAYEIGGHGTIAAHSLKLRGIRNGIDPDIWDPETDMFLPMHYTSETVKEGKAAAKAALRSRLNLTGWQAENKPLIGVVSRLTAQKGVHLIKHSARRTLDRGGQFVLLGSAPDPKVQEDFNGLAASLRVCAFGLMCGSCLFTNLGKTYTGKPGALPDAQLCFCRARMQLSILRLTSHCHTSFMPHAI